MKFLYSTFLLPLLIIILILKSVTVWSSSLDKIKIIEENIYLSQFDILDFKKKPTRILDKNIDYYILNFWASWCAPCIKEMNSFNKLKEKFAKVKILTISQDADINDAIDFFKKNDYDNLQKFYDFDKRISSNFSLRGLPTTFIFNKKLKAFAKVEGIVEWDSNEFIKWLSSF